MPAEVSRELTIPPSSWRVTHHAEQRLLEPAGLLQRAELRGCDAARGLPHAPPPLGRGDQALQSVCERSRMAGLDE